MPRTHPQAPQPTTGPSDCNMAKRWESNPRRREGLSLLLDGFLYATELGRDRWEFALEIEFLHTAGLTNNDFRWLVAKGYVERAVETTAKGKVRRRVPRSGRLALPKGSCFVLTDAGVQFAHEALASREPGSPKHGSEMPSPDVPHWDAETHSLYWRGRLVKHFKHEAPFQEAILEAFEVAKWPCYIVVTLPKEEGVNPKERLHETIKNLNRSCGKRLRFTQEGSGGRVGWHAVE